MRRSHALACVLVAVGLSSAACFTRQPGIIDRTAVVRWGKKGGGSGPKKPSGGGGSADGGDQSASSPKKKAKKAPARIDGNLGYGMTVKRQIRLVRAVKEMNREPAKGTKAVQRTKFRADEDESREANEAKKSALKRSEMALARIANGTAPARGAPPHLYVCFSGGPNSWLRLSAVGYGALKHACGCGTRDCVVGWTCSERGATTRHHHLCIRGMDAGGRALRLTPSSLFLDSLPSSSLLIGRRFVDGYNVIGSWARSRRSGFCADDESCDALTASLGGLGGKNAARWYESSGSEGSAVGGGGDGSLASAHSAPGGMAGARRALYSALCALAPGRGWRVTLVFDAYKNTAARGGGDVKVDAAAYGADPRVAVVFTARGQTADAFIEVRRRWGRSRSRAMDGWLERCVTMRDDAVTMSDDA